MNTTENSTIEVQHSISDMVTSSESRDIPSPSAGRSAGRLMKATAQSYLCNYE